MAISLPSRAATTPTPTPATTGPHRAFTSEPGTYEAVCAAAAVQYELEAIDAALQAAGVSVTLITERLGAARARLEEATNAYMAGFPC